MAVWPLYNWKYTDLSMSHDQKLTLLPGFYPSTFLQPVNGCKNSISSSLFKYFFVCLSRKTLDRLFILLHHCFYSGKPQICTKQTGLNIQFHKKISAAAFKKSKTNMMVVQMLLFLFLCVLLIAQWRDCLRLLRYLVIKPKALGT